MDIFRRPEFSNWRIAGSAGVDVQVETPVVNVSVGGGYLQLPLENRRTGENITLHMAGAEVGIGLGASVFGIVDIEGSINDFPSDGIGRMVVGPRGRKPIRSDDFLGNRVMMVSVGYKTMAGMSLTAIAFIKPSLVASIASAAIPGPADDIIWSHAGGLFWGASVGSGASVGVTYSEFAVVRVVEG